MTLVTVSVPAPTWRVAAAFSRTVRFGPETVLPPTVSLTAGVEAPVRLSVVAAVELIV